MNDGLELETKFCRQEAGLRLEDGVQVAGYASLYGRTDRGGDVVQRGAYATSLAAMAREGRKVKMLWQHDPGQPIGVWDDVREDATGLYVKGRLLPDVARAREAQALLAAGAVDGLSIGYRTLRAEKLPGGGRRLLELDLWEVSLVTFPMQASARIDRKSDATQDIALLTAQLRAARAALASL